MENAMENAAECEVLTKNDIDFKKLYSDIKKRCKSNPKFKELLAETEKARLDIEAAEINFDSVSQREQVDVIIYELRRAQTRYCSLLEQMRDMS